MNDNRDLDERLRALLEPDGNAVDRLVAGALKPEAQPLHRGNRSMRFALAGAGILVSLATLLWFSARAPETPDELIISPFGDVMLVQSSSGESWIIGPGRPNDWLPAGTGFVIVEGEIQ